MSMEESISLEETNRIRISLGFKPLTDDKAPADDKEKQAEDNYAKQRDKETKERETKYVSCPYILVPSLTFIFSEQEDSGSHSEVSMIPFHCASETAYFYILLWVFQALTFAVSTEAYWIASASLG